MEVTECSTGQNGKCRGFCEKGNMKMPYKCNMANMDRYRDFIKIERIYRYSMIGNKNAFHLGQSVQ